MTNSPLEHIQSSIGSEFANSPSPLQGWLKGKVLSAEEGNVSLSFFIRDEMTNPIGTLHGGVIAAIMDEVIGVAAYSLGGNHFNTSVNLNVDFFYPAYAGDTVFAHSQVIKNGKNIKNIQCELRNENNRVLAKGYSNLFTTSIQR